MGKPECYIENFGADIFIHFSLSILPQTELYLIRKSMQFH